MIEAWGVRFVSDLGQPPAHEAFQRFVFRQAQLIVSASGAVVSVFGALPEFAAVARAWKERQILLTFVLEDRHALADDFIGRKRHGHLNFVRLPFLPGPAIEPDRALLHPRT